MVRGRLGMVGVTNAVEAAVGLEASADVGVCAGR